MSSLAIYSKTEIKKELENSYQKIFDLLEEQPEDVFSVALEKGKWSTGQHLHHLIKSTLPLNKALRLPLFTLKGMFGKMNGRPERTYEGLVEKYQAKLALGPVNAPVFAPKNVQNSDKASIINRLRSELENLHTIIDKWEEEKMGVYLLPHPLLGKLSIREMLFFTIYHTEHHYKAIANSNI